MAKRFVKREVTLLGIVSMFTDIGSEMIFSVLSMFLTTVLHMGGAVIGIVEGIAESSASLLRFVSGWFTDRFKRAKPFMLLGYALSAASKFLFPIAQGLAEILTARVTDRIGKGFRGTPRDVMLASYGMKKERGKVFGVHRMLDKTGAIIGPLIAMLIFPIIGFNKLFWIATIPGIVSVLVIIFLIKEPKINGFNDKRIRLDSEPKRISFSLKGFDKNFKWTVISSAIFALANFSYAFMLIKANSIGISVASVITMYFIFNLSYVISAIPMGMLSDLKGRKSIVFMAYVLFAVMCLLFVFATAKWVFLLFVFYGIVMAILEGVQNAFVADMVPSSKRGTALGAFNGITGIIVLPASLIAGFLFQFVSKSAPFIFGAVLAIIAAAILFFKVRQK